MTAIGGVLLYSGVQYPEICLSPHAMKVVLSKARDLRFTTRPPPTNLGVSGYSVTFLENGDSVSWLTVYNNVVTICRGLGQNSEYFSDTVGLHSFLSDELSILK